MGWFSDLFNPGKSAAKEANKGVERQTATLQKAYSDVGNLYKPYQQSGGAAYQRLTDLNGYNGAPAQTAAGGTFRTDPGYQFKMDQGVQAIDRSAAAQGNLASGQTLKALTEYGQGLADQSYGDWYGRQAALADTGANATSAIASAAQNTAAGVGAGYAQIGQNNANGKIATANNTTGLISGGLRALFGM